MNYEGVDGRRKLTWHINICVNSDGVGAERRGKEEHPKPPPTKKNAIATITIWKEARVEAYFHVVWLDNEDTLLYACSYTHVQSRRKNKEQSLNHAHTYYLDP